MVGERFSDSHGLCFGGCPRSESKSSRFRDEPPQTSTLSFPTPLHARQPLMDDSWDEYDAYDLSEFSAADFVHIDNTATTTTTTSAPATPRDRTTAAPEEEAAAADDFVVVVAGGEAWGRVVVGTGGSGGLPQVAVALESAADESVVVKVAEGAGGSGGLGNVGAVEDAPRRSPFEEFRRRGTLSVSDLVGPAWYVPCLACRG